MARVLVFALMICYLGAADECVTGKEPACSGSDSAVLLQSRVNVRERVNVDSASDSSVLMQDHVSVEGSARGDSSTLLQNRIKMEDSEQEDVEDEQDAEEEDEQMEANQASDDELEESDADTEAIPYSISDSKSQCPASSPKCSDKATCDAIAKQLGQSSAKELKHSGWRHNQYPGGCFLQVKGGKETGVTWNPNVKSTKIPHWGDYRFICLPEAATVDVVEIKGKKCVNDDKCTSKAKCPSGYFLESCVSIPVDSGDGIRLISTTECTGRPFNFGSRASDIQVIATCGKKPVQLVNTQKGRLAFSEDFLRLKCPAGMGMKWCYCDSAWGLCPHTAFPPENGFCKSKYMTPSQSGYGGQESWGKHRRRGVDSGQGIRLAALCQKEKCGKDQFWMDAGDMTGDAQCLDSCPEGYVETKRRNGKKAGSCEPCMGETTRRRAKVCNRCGPGHVPQVGSDFCVNMQSSCCAASGGLASCRKCLQGVAGTLGACVKNNGEQCYHPGTTWCPEAILGGQKCKMHSVGCYYNLLCSAKCICKAWKDVFCGGLTREEPCGESFMFLEENETYARMQLAELKANEDSLDTALTGKRSCA